MRGSTIISIIVFICILQVIDAGKVLRHVGSASCIAPEGSTICPVSGTKLLHTYNCKDASAFFIIHSNGVIEHEASGLCVFLTLGPMPSVKSATLSTDCSNTFRVTDEGAIRHVGVGKSLCRNRADEWEINYWCAYYGNDKYEYVDVTQGCDLSCLGNIVQAVEQSQTFDEFYAFSEKEASTTTESSSFLSHIKTSSPEFYKDLLSTSFPLNPIVLENMVELVKHFGIETVKQYRSLFLGAAYISRHYGVHYKRKAACEGWSRVYGGTPIENLENLSENELKVLLDEEDYKAQTVIDEERGEENGTSNYTISQFQKIIDSLEAEFYYKLWTEESLESAQKRCKFENVSQIKFPPRSIAMSTIESLEYFLSRNKTLLPQNSFDFPWPLTLSLHIETSFRECNWVWRRLENGEKIIRYSYYSWNFKKTEIACKESDWSICSIPRIIEDGGACGRQSQLERVTDQCLGIPANYITQPGHAALYKYKYNNGEYKFTVHQSINNMMNTYAYWELSDDSGGRGQNINAEYHKALIDAMNHGYESYREGRVALLLYSRIYEKGQRNQARELLIKALEGNPYMMGVWMKLIHETTEAYHLAHSNNVLGRLPSRCTENLLSTERNRLLLLVKTYLSSYTQMYMEILLRLIAPPCCCSPQRPELLTILKDAEENELRAIIKNYILEAYEICALETHTIEHYVITIERRFLEIIGRNNDEEMEAFSDLIGSFDNIISKRNKTEVKVYSERIKEFYLKVCRALPRLHVTTSAWMVLKQYRECVEYQLKFLQKFIPNDYATIASDLETLKNTSEKSSSFWAQFYNNGWLYGRSIDVIPLVTGIKKSVNGGGIVTVKVNLAKGKSTTMSTTSGSGKESYRAVDGLLDQNYGGESCIETTYQDNPWFRVDLGSDVMVSAVFISNVNGLSGNRLRSFEVRVGNSNDLTNDRCGEQHSIDSGEAKVIFCSEPLTGRYVTVSIPRKARLNFCEIEVYDTTIEEIDACSSKLDNCHEFAQCSTTGPATFECVCNEGYTGDGRTCTEIFACEPDANHCSPHATCFSTASGISECSCNEGFTGDGRTCEGLSIRFLRKSKDDYVQLYDTPPLSAMTTCLWANITVINSGESNLLTYSTDIQENTYAILLSRKSEMEIGVNGDYTTSGAYYPTGDGQWHPLCFTWSNTDGLSQFYLNGELQSQRGSVEPGYTIPNYGVWILGQEPDAFGGKFDINQQFLGELSNVNVWDRVLTEEEIREFSSSCLPGNLQGNVKSWKDFYSAKRNGDLYISAAPSCLQVRTLI